MIETRIRRKDRPKAPPKPREWWAVGGMMFREKEQAELIASEDRVPVIRVREVLPSDTDYDHSANDAKTTSEGK